MTRRELGQTEHMAIFVGTDVDHPRNLAKSVTVEWAKGRLVPGITELS